MPPHTVSGDAHGVKAVRLLIATVALAVAVSLAAVVALAAPNAVARVASPSVGAAQGVYCPAKEKQRRRAELKRAQAQVVAFRKSTAVARKRYFRTHKSAKQRATFVKKQNAQLKAMQAIVKRKQRDLARCS